MMKLTNAKLLMPDMSIKSGDILIKDGLIAQIGKTDVTFCTHFRYIG